MNVKSLKGRTVEEFLSTCMKKGDWKNRAAKQIFKNNPGLFENVEQVRSLIRYQVGSLGKTSRKKVPASKHVQPDTDFVNLPDLISNRDKHLAYTIKEDNCLILSDLHIPYGDKKAIKAALTYGRDLGSKLERILLNGDNIDFKRISHWLKDPLDPRIYDELTIWEAFIKQLRQMFPNVPIDVREGNHEFRWQSYLFRKAEEISELEELRLDRILKLSKHGMDWVPNKISIKFGKLNIIHGHEYGRSIFSPVNPAKGLFNRSMGSNAICGHFHRTSEHIWGNLEEEIKGTWSMGCLCDLYPDYAPKPFNTWNHGFAFVEKDKSGEFMVHNYMIINGKVV